jgi:quercetin dioxygenase-like cupin family protein
MRFSNMGEQPVLLEPGQGRSVSLRGTEVVFKVQSSQAQGASCVDFQAAPGFDTGLHLHRRLEETFYVLEGQFEFQLGDEAFHANAGACVFVPPQVPHAFANRTDAPAKLLLILSPPGHDRYFDELSGILAAEGAPDSEAIATLRERYDTEQLSSLTADADDQAG